MLLIGLKYSNDNAMPTVEKMTQAHSVYYVLLHTPGENWQKKVPYKEQQGIEEHLQYVSAFFEDNKMLMKGQFIDNPGGMIICNMDETEVKQLAQADPAVQKGVLKVKVLPWLVSKQLQQEQ